MQDVKVEAHHGKSLAQAADKTKSKSKQGVTWTRCASSYDAIGHTWTGGQKVGAHNVNGTEVVDDHGYGGCQCASSETHVTVIRYRQASSRIARERAYENHHYRQTLDGEYSHTPEPEFNKGFKNNQSLSPPGIDPINPGYPRITVQTLQTCGGTIANSEDCWYQPETCTFDAEDNNPHDAKAGEFCCSAEFKYCSYKCEGNEVFHCPHGTQDSNFLGGMDPTGDDLEKACFIATYEKGLIPEYMSDADISD
jgi:hypothetical protein